MMALISTRLYLKFVLHRLGLEDANMDILAFPEPREGRCRHRRLEHILRKEELESIPVPTEHDGGGLLSLFPLKIPQ